MATLKTRRASLPRVLMRAIVPRLAVPTILDPRFTSLMRTKTNVDITEDNIIFTGDRMSFDILHCHQVPIDRVEVFVVTLSKLLNGRLKDTDTNGLQYNYRSLTHLRTKLLFPNRFIEIMKNNDEIFQKFNSDQWIYIDNLGNGRETAVMFKVYTQSQVLEYLKIRYLEFLNLQQGGELKFSTFGELQEQHIMEDVQEMKYGDITKVMENKIVIEHNSGCTIEVPKFDNEDHDVDDILEIHVTGMNRFNTVKGIRNINLYKTN